MKLPEGFYQSAEKYIAARNALVAKHTYETLEKDEKQKVNEYILDLLILSGIHASRAPRYLKLLRETQYYGMAALAMAFLGIRPALPEVLFREQWASLKDPLVALTGAETEIRMAADEILRKHGVLITLSDEDKQGGRWESLIQESWKPKNMN